MHEFVNGTDEQFNILKESLNDRLCHVYPKRNLPRSCSQSTGRIGFENEGDMYALFIDKGITCSSTNAPSLFHEWLAVGTLRFLDFTDMKEFIRSLSCLY